MWFTEQVPRLIRLERLQRPQLVHHNIRNGKDLATAQPRRHILSIQRLEALNGESTVVAELDALSEGLALALAGFSDGHDVGLLLVRLLHLLGEVAAALDGRGSGEDGAARREGGD